ncbi:hypothetical protein CEXT_676771 [Caerostris extrusa]|uniref:Uncharacterized protein n=1 Tax=Caerostris extrusa TaxID=172846 RepID=A0AAV4X6B8_CAEEX|nr:hypothetical protein CEXT_676771 [Caerostris extrusa]
MHSQRTDFPTKKGTNTTTHTRRCRLKSMVKAQMERKGGTVGQANGWPVQRRRARCFVHLLILASDGAGQVFGSAVYRHACSLSHWTRSGTRSSAERDSLFVGCVDAFGEVLKSAPLSF